MRGERFLDGGGVIWRGDDNRRLAGGEAFAEEGADGREQLSLITIELHGVMMLMEMLVATDVFMLGPHNTSYRTVRRSVAELLAS